MDKFFETQDPNPEPPSKQEALEIGLAMGGKLIRPTREMIFVFGSNEAGRHGGGAAYFAYEHKGAKMGVAFGPAGRSFAIPTKDASIRNTLPLIDIRHYVDGFLKYAKEHPGATFQISQIGCGLAGLEAYQIAPMFSRAPSNCLFDTAWIDWLERHKFWGTFP